MVNVGINENVILTKAEVSTENNKVSLSLSFREGGDITKTANPFAQLQSGEEVDTGNTLDKTVKMWPPLPPKDTKPDGTTPKTHAEQVKEASDAMGEIQNSLLQIMKCYTTSDKIKFNMFAGMDNIINAENYESRIIQEEILVRAFNNLVDQFAEQVKPFLDKEEFPLRLLLVRQKKKHYPEIRRRFVKDQPFVEIGTITKEQSKLKFTEFEIKAGLDKPEYLTQADADAPDDVDSAFNTEGNGVFGGQS